MRASHSKQAALTTIGGPPAILASEVDDLIARLEGALDPIGRAGFRAAAEADMPVALRGPGSIYRELEKVWRPYFHPPSGVESSWEKNERRGRPRTRFKE